jgi:hypothetical protein
MAAASVHQTPDGGYITFGESGEPDGVHVTKTDENGNLLWTKLIPEGNHGSAMEPTRDGGYIAAGSTGRASTYFPYLIKLDSNGDMRWDATVNNTRRGVCSDVCGTYDGGYVATGRVGGVSVDDPIPNLYLAKTDHQGNVQWERTFGDQYVHGAEGHSVLQTHDRGFLVGGEIDRREPGPPEPYLIRTDSSGNLQWEIIGAGFAEREVRSVRRTTDGGYIAAGHSNYSAFLIKLAPDGPPPLRARPSWSLYR